MKRILFPSIIVFLATSNHSIASTSNLSYWFKQRVEATSVKVEEVIPSSQPSKRFSSYGANYLALAVPTYDSSDYSLEGQVSIRYNFTEGGEFFFHFQNRFDFYASTRDSGPIITRDEMPGFSIDLTEIDSYNIKQFINNNLKLDKLILTPYQHWSNGQLLDVDNPNNLHSVSLSEYEPAYNNYLNESATDVDRFLIDSLSRARNYTSLAIVKHLNSLTIAARAILFNLDSAEDKIFSGPYQNAKMVDYDRFLVNIGWNYKQVLLMFESRFGDKWLATDSHSLTLQWKNDSVPLYIEIDDGPFQRLSDYTRNITTYSVGFGFIY